VVVRLGDVIWQGCKADTTFDRLQQAINIVNTYALTASPQSLAKMEEVFIKTSRLEWMFWDSAHKQEEWKI